MVDPSQLLKTAGLEPYFETGRVQEQLEHHSLFFLNIETVRLRPEESSVHQSG